MTDNDSGDIGAFLAGFVIGGLVGAATALILAPQSGEETRSQIARKGVDLRRAGEHQLLEYRERAEAAVGEARELVEQTSGQAQERARIVLDEGKERVRQAIDKGKEQVSKTMEDLSAEATTAEVPEDKDA
jgi:gas vesicle protein